MSVVMTTGVAGTGRDGRTGQRAEDGGTGAAQTDPPPRYTAGSAETWGNHGQGAVGGCRGFHQVGWGC